MDTQPKFTHVAFAQTTDSPSPRIDNAILDLIAHISDFSDDYFDASYVAVSESELEQLVVLLLQHWTESLNGRLLAGILLSLRETQEKEDQ